MARPFRFATLAPPTSSFADMAAQARAAEESGFDLLVLLASPASVSPIATLTALASHTTTLRYSPLVANAGSWRPDLLVREFRTADQISGGRLEIGIGAGVSPGGPARPLAHLRSTIEALGDWEGRPPLLVAGSGDRLLATAGRSADIVGIAGPIPAITDLPRGHTPLLSPAATDDRIAAIRAGAGDRFGDLELNVGAEVRLTDDRLAAAEEAQPIHSYLTVDEILASPKFLAGTTDEIAEQLVGHRERYGITYFATIGVTPADFAPVIGALGGPASPGSA